MSTSITESRAIGEMMAQRAQAKAEAVTEGFGEKAKRVILQTLESGPRSGEDLTDACKLAGIRPREDRAFGGVFAGLAAANLIVPDGFCLRRKGHGTAGGRIWRKA